MSMRLLGYVFFSFIFIALALGLDEQQYLYLDRESASVVTEHSSEHSFESSNAPRLVEFYSPFCGGCRNFKPNYVELAKDLTLKYSDVEVYAVSCVPHKSLCNKHKISGYPSLYAFPEGSTEGVYLQRSSMGGSYSINSIAKALNLRYGGKTSVKTLQSRVDRKLTTDDQKDGQKQKYEKKSSPSATSNESSYRRQVKEEKGKAVTANEVDSKENEDRKGEEDESDNSDNEDEKEDNKETNTSENEGENEEVAETESKKEVQEENSRNDEDAESEKKKETKKDNLDSNGKTVKENHGKGDTSDNEDKKQAKSNNGAAKVEEKDGEGEKDQDEKQADKKEVEEKDEKEDKKGEGEKDKGEKDKDEKDEGVKDEGEKEEDEKEEGEKEEVEKEEGEKEEGEKEEGEKEEGEKEEGVKEEGEKEEGEKEEVAKEEVAKEKVAKEEDEKEEVEKEEDEKEEDGKEEVEKEEDEKEEGEKEEDEKDDGEKDEGESNEGTDTDDEEKEKEDEEDHNAALAPRKGVGSKSHKIFTGLSGGKRNQAAGAGALKASTKSRYMDKYQDIIGKKKKQLEVSRSKKSMSFLRPLFIKNGRKYFGPGSKVMLQAPGKSGDTKVMLKNKPGTTEFEARKREIMERITKSRSGRKFLPFMSRRSKLDPNAKLINKLKLPFKKEPVKPGFLRRSFENIPMVKNVFKMNPEEELILDATLSLITGLKHGVYSDDNPLSSKKKEALRTWLNLLSIGLPPEWGLHVLIDSLTNQINIISNSQQSLLNILDKYPLPRKRWSESCDKRGTGGFSCGMWKLLHIVTVGVAQHRGGQNLIDSGLMDSSTFTFSPYDAAEAIRDYMDNFYSCDECRNHFLKQYEDCEFRRCERLTSDESTGSADDWKQLSLWLWEVHNDVNVRVANRHLEQLQKKLSTQHLQGAQHLKIVHKREDEIRSIWPSLEDCLPCFDDSGKWNEDSVFEFLERTYWDAPDAKFDRLLTKRILDGEDVSGGGLVWTMMIMAVIVVLFVRYHVSNVAIQNEIKRIHMPSSVLGMKNKISDVVAGKHRTA